jgi:hypothetical protein
MPAVIAVDVEGAVKTWIDGLGLVTTVGNATGIKAALKPLRSGPPYLLLSRIGGLQETAGRDAARITAVAHGPTKQVACDVAVQFANAVWNLAPGLIAPGVFCNAAEVDSGPTEIPDVSGSSRYSVEVSLYVGPG